MGCLLRVCQGVVPVAVGYSGPGWHAGDLAPNGEAVLQLGPVFGCGHQVAAGSEIGRYPAECGEEYLCVPR
jgi:hypothetical protein